MKHKITACCLAISMCMLSACSNFQNQADFQQSQETLAGAVEIKANIMSDKASEITSLCQDIYEQTRGKDTLRTPETVGKFVACLGDGGYAAVDQDNQIDMVHPEQVETFIGQVEQKQAASLTFILVLNNGNFVQYNLSSTEGEVHVSTYDLSWKENALAIVNQDQFQANTWVYSENGYLFFDKYYMEGFEGPYDHTALRVKPLDETCRELNRKYIRPIGYNMNNLFTVDWSEEDYGGLNFYDLFEILYPMEFAAVIPYAADYEGQIGQIPENEFEEVFMKYFHISSQVLQEKTSYFKADGTYEYRPRGRFDTSSGTTAPFPEVISYEDMGNDLWKLTVNAVWPGENAGSVFMHEVVIRKLSDGGFQYVSNRVVPSEHGIEPVWYVERLTEAQWQDAYGAE